MSTPAALRITSELDHYFRQLDRERITHWLMRLSSGRSTDIDDGLGGRITIGGVKFSGTPRRVFWSFIHPILEAKVVEVCKQVEREIAGYSRQDALSTLESVSGALKGLVARTFRSMADVDRRLRGNGDPKSVGMKDVTADVRRHHMFIDANITALRKILPEPPAPPTPLSVFGQWCLRHGWNLFFGALSILGVIIGVLAL